MSAREQVAKAAQDAAERRAWERQEQARPSWADAPEWANWLGQDDEGEWFWESHKPDPKDGFWNSLVGSKSEAAGSGLLLGDWRDTLEQRPDKYKTTPEIDTSADRVQETAKSMPVTSMSPEAIARRMEQFEAGNKANHRNVWHERGELPPVGTECEFHRIDGSWVKAWTVGLNRHGLMVVQFNDEHIAYAHSISHGSYRPLRTEREHLLDLINGGLLAAVESDKIADAILAAGFKRGAA